MSDCQNKRRIGNDLLLIGGLLATIITVLALLLFFQKPGQAVCVYIDGEIAGEYDLSEALQLEIRSGENDENTNTLHIENGEVTVTHSNCKEQICVEHWPISKEGETIVCLPHKLVISITSGDIS